MDGAAQPKGREVLEEAASNLWFKARQQKSPTVHIMFVCLLCWFGVHTVFYGIVIQGHPFINQFYSFIQVINKHVNCFSYFVKMGGHTLSITDVCAVFSCLVVSGSLRPYGL